METNKTFPSKMFILILKVIIILAVLLFIFGLGMFVGQKKVQFKYARRESYCCNILPFYFNPRSNLAPQRFGSIFEEQKAINTYGVVGQILKNSDNKLVVLDRDGIEKVVVITEETTIKYLQKTINLNDCKVNDIVAVIGRPLDNGQIEARFVRLLPKPENVLPPRP